MAILIGALTVTLFFILKAVKFFMNFIAYVLTFCLINLAVFPNSEASFTDVRSFTEVERLAHINNLDIDKVLQAISWSSMPRDYFNGCWDHPYTKDLLEKAVDSEDSWLFISKGLLPSHKASLIPGILKISKNRSTLPPSFYPLFVDVVSFFEYIYHQLDPQLFENNPDPFVVGLSPMLANDLINAIDERGLFLPKFRKAISKKAMLSTYKRCCLRCARFLSNGAEITSLTLIILPSASAIIMMLF